MEKWCPSKSRAFEGWQLLAGRPFRDLRTDSALSEIEESFRTICKAEGMIVLSTEGDCITVAARRLKFEFTISRYSHEVVRVTAKGSFLKIHDLSLRLLLVILVASGVEGFLRYGDMTGGTIFPAVAFIVVSYFLGRLSFSAVINEARAELDKVRECMLKLSVLTES